MLRTKRYSKVERKYNRDTLSAAVAVVKARRMTVSQASREYLVPRKTLGTLCLTLPKHLMELPVFMGVRIALALVFDDICCIHVYSLL